MIFYSIPSTTRNNGAGPKLVARVAASHLLFRFVLKKKPFLSAKARRNRLKWITTGNNADWTAIIWRDECMVRIGDRGRRWAIMPLLTDQVAHFADL